METLSIANLITSAHEFCIHEKDKQRKELFSITDGKAVGTFVEHLFQDFLSKKYNITIGSSASGLDLPSINTDIKVTSIKQPQSSSPYKDSKQKIYGLGYNLIIFVYEKHNNNRHQTSCLNFVSCVFISAERTGDYQMTTGLQQIIQNNGNAEDIFAFLCAHRIPADEITLMQMAKEILHSPPPIGYLTISNALQWRLQYGRVVNLKEQVDGITTIVQYE